MVKNFTFFSSFLVRHLHKQCVLSVGTPSLCLLSTSSPAIWALFYSFWWNYFLGGYLPEAKPFPSLPSSWHLFFTHHCWYLLETACFNSTQRFFSCASLLTPLFPTASGGCFWRFSSCQTLPSFHFQLSSVCWWCPEWYLQCRSPVSAPDPGSFTDIHPPSQQGLHGKPQVLPVESNLVQVGWDGESQMLAHTVTAC